MENRGCSGYGLLLSSLVTSVIVVFLAISIPVGENQDSIIAATSTNSPFRSTVESSTILYPFELVDNLIEYDFVDEESCDNFIYGTIIAFDNQTIMDNVGILIEVYLEGGNDISSGFIFPDTDSDNLQFSIGPSIGRRYDIWLRDRRSGEDLSQHIHIDLSGCSLGIARLDFIQIRDF